MDLWIDKYKKYGTMLKRRFEWHDFLKEVIKTTGNEYASLVSDGVEVVMLKNLLTLVHMAKCITIWFNKWWTTNKQDYCNR